MVQSTIAAMQASRRWLVCNEKKIPFYINGKPRSGQLDSDEDMAQLAGYQEAISALVKLGHGHRLGFALGPDGTGGYWQGIDLDDVEENNLAEIAHTLPGYVEYSPSGKGTHAIGYGAPFDTLASDGSGTEAYTKRRYFTVTTNVIKDEPLCDLSHFVAGSLLPRRKSFTAHKNPFQLSTAADADTIRELFSALSYLDSNVYDVWIDVGLALKSLGETGYKLWLAWSATSPHFKDGQARAKWIGFKPFQITYKSIFYQAKLQGWSKTIPTVAPSPRYQFLGAADLKSLPPFKWLIQKVVPEKGFFSIYGPSGSGKSFLALDMACAIALGKPWFSFRTKQAPVLYIALEGENGFKLRGHAWSAHNHREMPEMLRFLMFQSFSLTDMRDIKDLVVGIPKGCVVFIDTLNRAAPGIDENSNKDMSNVIEGAKHLQSLTDGLVVLVAHTGKDGSKELRGHSSLKAALDGALFVERVEKTQTRKWIVAKSKDDEDGREYGFYLEVIEVGQDEFKEIETSCVVVSAELDSKRKSHSNLQKIGLQSFNKAAFKKGHQSQTKLSLEVDLEDWREAFFEMWKASTKGSKTRAFNRAKQELQDSIVISNDICSLIFSTQQTEVGQKTNGDKAASCLGILRTDGTAAL